jgi:hypothetical protein
VKTCINYVEHTGEIKTLCYDAERVEVAKDRVVIHDIIAFDALILVKCEEDVEFHQATEDISNNLARYYIEYREVYYRGGYEEVVYDIEITIEYYVRIFDKNNNDIATGKFLYRAPLFGQGSSYLELELKKPCRLLIEYSGRVYELA